MDVFIYLKKTVILGTFLTSSFLLGCSGIKPYPTGLDNNLVITTTTKSGSVFSSVNASLDIYQVKPDCTLEYEGTVKLDKATVAVGIPTQQFRYLVFVFASSSFLASTSGSISHETLLKPRKGYKYLVTANYIDDIYNVEINETHPHKKTSRNIDMVALSACK